MAITLADALVYIGGDDSPLGPVFDRVRKNTTGLVNDLGNTVLKLGTGAVIGGAGALVAGVGAIGSVALNGAREVSDAQALLQSQFNLSKEEAQELGGVIKEVYGDNFGNDIADVAGAVGDVTASMGRLEQLSVEALESVTEKAFGVRDAFDKDVGESTDAAAALMEQFGLSADEAMNFITTGLQDASINNEDFLETVSEYSTHFSAAGFDAEKFYNILVGGSDSGINATDKVGDAIKEMNLRLLAGGDDTKDAFDLIGLSFDDIESQVRSGQASWGDYFGDIIGGLQDIEDPVAQQIAMFAIFGTQAEDLGVSWLNTADDWSKSLADITADTGSLSAQYNTWGSFVEGMKRKVEVGLMPMGNILLNIGNNLMPVVNQAFNWFTNNIIPKIETGALIVQQFMGAIKNGLDAGLTPMQAFREALAQFIPPETMAQIDGIIAVIGSFIGKVQEFVSKHSQELKAALVAIGAVLAAAAIATTIMGIVGAIAALANPITLVIGIVAALAAAWEGNWLGIRDATMNVIDWLVPFVSNAIQNIKDWWAENGEAIMANIKQVWDAIVAYFEGIIETIKHVFAAFQAAFEGDWKAFGENLRKAWEEYWQTITDFLGTLWSLMEPKFTEVWNNLKGWFDGINWGQLMEDVVDGLIGGLSGGVGRISAKLREIGQAAMEAWNGFWGNQSPSKLMMASGHDIADGAEIALASRARGLARTMSNLGGNMQAAFASATINNGAGNRTFSSSDQFIFDNSNEQSARLAASLVNQHRRNQIKGFMKRG